MILLCLVSSTTPRRRNLLVALAQYTVTYDRAAKPWCQWHKWFCDYSRASLTYKRSTRRPGTYGSLRCSRRHSYWLGDWSVHHNILCSVGQPLLNPSHCFALDTINTFVWPLDVHEEPCQRSRISMSIESPLSMFRAKSSTINNSCVSQEWSLRKPCWLAK